MSEAAKLKWHCRRGMRELDVLLVTYCEKYYPTASEVEQRTFAQFLELQDDLIFDYLFGSSQPNTAEFIELVNKIKMVLHAPV